MSIAPAETTEILTPTISDFLVPAEEEQTAPKAGEEAELDVSDLPLEETPGTNEDKPDGEDEDGEEEKPTDVEKLPLPSSWSKEDAKEWEDLTPGAQAVVARREAERDKYVRKVGFEASQTRQQVESQARDVIAQMHDSHVQALTTYAQQFMPSPPDQRLLYSNNQEDVLLYHRQEAAYRTATDQQQQLHQQIAQAQQQANLARTQTQQAERASDAQRLKEQLPEWFDPSEGPKLQTELQSIGTELGYPVELMAEASSVDILALKTAGEWRSKAAKYDQLIAKKMEGVRAAKEMPRMARPGVAPTRSQQQASTANRRSQALNSFGQTRSGEDAAALLLERKR